MPKKMLTFQIVKTWNQHLRDDDRSRVNAISLDEQRVRLHLKGNSWDAAFYLLKLHARCGQ